MDLYSGDGLEMSGLLVVTWEGRECTVNVDSYFGLVMYLLAIWHSISTTWGYSDDRTKKWPQKKENDTCFI